MRRRQKWWAAILGLSLSLVLFFGGCYWILTSGHVNGLLRVFIEDELSAQLEVPCKIGTIEGNPLGRYRIIDVVVGNVFAADTIGVRVKPVLGFRVVVDTILVKGVVVHVVDDDGGEAEPTDLREIRTYVPFEIVHLEIVRGTLTVGQGTTISDLSFRGGLSATGSRFDLVVAQYQSVQFQPPLVISNVNGIGILDNGKVTLQDVRVSLPNSHFTVNGTFENLHAPVFDLTFGANPLGTADLRSFLKGAMPDVTVTVTGSLVGDLNSSVGKIQAVLDASQLELDFNGSLAPLEGTVAAKVRMNNMDLTAFYADAQDIFSKMNGIVDLEAKLDSTGIKSLQTEGTLKDFEIYQMRQEQAQFGVSFDGQEIGGKLTTQGRLGLVEIEGAYNLELGSASGNASFVDLDLGLIPVVPAEVGKTTGQLSVVVDSLLHASLGVDKMYYDALLVEDLHVQAGYGDGRVAVNRFEATVNPFGTQIFGAGEAMVADVVKHTVGRITSTTDLRVATADTTWGDSLTLETTFDLKIDKGVRGETMTLGRWHNFEGGINHLRVQNIFDGTTAVHVDASARGNIGHLQTLGHVTYAGNLDLGFAGNITQVHILAGRIGQAISSDLVDVEGQVGGTLDAPILEGQIETAQLVLGDVPVNDLRLSGKWVYPREGSVALRSGSLSWGDRVLKQVFLDATHKDRKTDFLFGSNAQQSDRIFLWGHVEDSEQFVHVVADSMHVQAAEVALYNRGPLQVTYDKTRGFHIDSFELSGPAGHIVAQDHSDLRSAIEVLLKDIDLRPWAFLLGLPEISGHLDAELAFSGELSDPLVFAEGDVKALGFYGLEFPSVTTDFSYGDKRVLVDVVAVPEIGTQISLSGSVPVEPDEPLQLDLRSRGFAVSILDTFLTGVNALGGDLDLNLNLRGSINEPVYKGRVKLSNGRLDHPSLGRVYEPIVASVRVDQAQVYVDSLRIGPEGKQFALSGQVDLAPEGLKRFDVMMGFQRFQPIHWPEFQAELDGHLKLSGMPTKPRLDGDLVVQQAEIRLGDLMATPSSGWEQWPFVQALQMAVRVRAEQQVWMRDPTFNIEMIGDLDVVKDVEGLKVFGTMQSRRGNYIFQNRRLDIARGDIFFQGRPEIDPDLDIEARTRVMMRSRNTVGSEPVIITVSVGGTLVKPVIALSSDPAVGDGQFNDVLSVLLVGATPEEIQVGNDAGEAASDLVLGTLANRFGQRVGEGLRLDLVEVDVAESNISRVRVGKYLTPRLFVSYAQDMISTGKEVAVEFKLLPSVTIEAKQIDAGKEEQLIKQTRESIGVVWEKEW